MSEDGWEESAEAWIASMGDAGDNGRQFTLDPAMLDRVSQMEVSTSLDVGCGEGRFSRMLSERGIRTTGIDPTHILLERARELHPTGVYTLGTAEKLPYPDGSFDLVVSCLTLVDIPDYKSAIAEMSRVLAPGGYLLVANMTDVRSAGMKAGWQYDESGVRLHFGITNYSSEWSTWVEWSGIRIRNWHRPLSAYMQSFLSHDLVLSHFANLEPVNGYDDAVSVDHSVPWFNLLEWRKPKPNGN